MIQRWWTHIWDDHNTKMDTILGFQKPNAWGFIETHRSLATFSFITKIQLTDILALLSGITIFRRTMRILVPINRIFWDFQTLIAFMF